MSDRSPAEGPPRYSRRKFLGKIAAVLTVAGLAGCAPKPPKAPTAETSKELKNHLPIYIDLLQTAANKPILRLNSNFQRFKKEFWTSSHPLKGGVVELSAGNALNNHGDPIAILGIGDLNENITQITISITENPDKKSLDKRVVISTLTLSKEEIARLRENSDPQGKQTNIFLVPDKTIAGNCFNSLFFTAELSKGWYIPGQETRESRTMFNPQIEITTGTNDGQPQPPDVFPLIFPPIK